MIRQFRFSDKEKEELVKSIVILVDTREQSCQHITDYFDKKGIPYKKKALKYGDYSFYIKANPELSIPRDLYFDMNGIVIERKKFLRGIIKLLCQRTRSV